MNSTTMMDLTTDPNWRPYCLMCQSMGRMVKTEYGFRCPSCGNTIKPDMTHYDPIAEQLAQIDENKIQ
ncbi:MAG TPA: hypothetical protein PLE74_07585 [Candidatus Cloacimonadota bacterium]|nr:hypothetical protein [Candidatus Cloacimonadota bacterium]